MLGLSVHSLLFGVRSSITLVLTICVLIVVLEVMLIVAACVVEHRTISAIRVALICLGLIHVCRIVGLVIVRIVRITLLPLRHMLRVL